MSPTSPLSVNPALPSDPALRAVATDVLDQLKYSFTAHAAGEANGAKGQLDGAIAEYLGTRKPAAREAYRRQARATLAAAPAQRTAALGRYAGVTPAVYRARGSEQLHALVARPTIDVAKLVAAATKLGHDLKIEPPKPKTPVLTPLAADVMAGAMFKKLSLIINRVECIEETDGLFEGPDEIRLGGTFTNTTGFTQMVTPFKVKDDFDTGEVKILDRPFATWNLDVGKNWPHVYGAVITMAEEDSGGFAGFILKLWSLVSSKVKQWLTDNLVKLGEELLGAFGAVLGQIVGGVLGTFLDWIIGLIHNADDIMGTMVLTMTLASQKKSYYDWAKLTTSAGCPIDLHYVAHGGHYRLVGGWKVSKS